VLRHHPEVAAAVGQKHVDAFLAAIDANPKDAVDGALHCQWREHQGS
jgi:hypothetical protein